VLSEGVGSTHRVYRALNLIQTNRFRTSVMMGDARSTGRRKMALTEHNSLSDREC
jgi:hypothetical protein